MTIKEAIDNVDALKTNMIPYADKVRWLSELDGRVYQEILLLHERNTNEPELPMLFTGYDENTPADTVLLIEDTYANIYFYQLSAQIELALAELQKYNNSVALLSNALRNYSACYTRSHMPVQRVKFLKI